MPTTKGRTSLRDDILSAIPDTFHGTRPWHQRIDPAVLAELEQIRDDWRAGHIDAAARTLARTIAQRLTDGGIVQIGDQGVLAWLKQNP